ncbi:DMT family transporter [Duganella sp. BJB488]|uniref:DMT family transporter n=1 Tax=unclassified Duganella TaxID=2636909 RepID=UPI000E3578B2|nr:MULTISPECIES: DMT family transporter [unclassified Duganella]RFP22950.1 DMT family transporter [Duganella sp. BJB489]RFP24974.1 DMT family transporter [Duganella sp. BJB488]RFP33949.1 DMT family transporter [Duganella sp. BJB480]
MLAAVAMFSFMDTTMKVLSSHYPATQVTAMRALSSLPLLCGYMLYRGAFRGILRVRWGMHIFRSLLGIAMLTSFAYGLKALSLAEAYSIFFIAPSLITALSVFVLKEKVGAGQWVAIVVGLLGVLVVLRPEGTGFLTLGGLALLGSAACYAMAAIASRVLARTDSNESMMFWYLLMMAAGGLAMSVSHWVPVRAEDGWVLLALALSGFLGQLAITRAFSSGKASVVAPFEYSALAWGVAIDWLLWHTLPDGYTLLGAGIIIASGIYLVRRESVHAEAEHP